MVRCRVTAKRHGTISSLDKRTDLEFVSDSQDVREIKRDFGNRPAIRDFDAFFVKIREGDYDEVFGIEGTVPNLDKSIWKIERKCK